jgi:hypothetical protein
VISSSGVAGMPFTGDSVPEMIWERDAWRSCADIFARSRGESGGCSGIRAAFVGRRGLMSKGERDGTKAMCRGENAEPFF